jgi:hypothetical protein
MILLVRCLLGSESRLDMITQPAPRSQSAVEQDHDHSCRAIGWRYPGGAVPTQRGPFTPTPVPRISVRHVHTLMIHECVTSSSSSGIRRPPRCRPTPRCWTCRWVRPASGDGLGSTRPAADRRYSVRARTAGPGDADRAGHRSWPRRLAHPPYLADHFSPRSPGPLHVLTSSPVES